ncbi:hypothetical protein AB0L88_03055 [Saccharopolyspora shandongensis]|uniref:hypothetical protein n=1 Tax=Saccharopolyspora shandongensis TaxID=418495 RepID=UPI0034126BF2
MVDDANTTEPKTSGGESYDEILGSPWLSEDERWQMMADSSVGHIAALLLRRGERATAELLIEVDRILATFDHEYDEWDLCLEVQPEQISLFTDDLVQRLREVHGQVCERLKYPFEGLIIREVFPEVGPRWREQIREQISPKRRPTNHARRVRTGPPRFTEDWLSFTNEGERRVYQALKQIQEKDLPRDSTIGIYPLAGGRVPGRTWEPDFLVTYKGRAGVLEVDGPHHNGRRAMDTTRDHLLRDAGVGFVDRITAESLDDAAELNAALRRFLRRLGEVS